MAPSKNQPSGTARISPQYTINQASKNNLEPCYDHSSLGFATTPSSETDLAQSLVSTGSALSVAGWTSLPEPEESEESSDDELTLHSKLGSKLPSSRPISGPTRVITQDERDESPAFARQLELEGASLRKSSSSKQFSSIRQTMTPPHKLSSYSGSSITTIGTLPSPAAVSEKKPSKAREVIDFVDVPALSKKTPTVQAWESQTKPQPYHVPEEPFRTKRLSNHPAEVLSHSHKTQIPEVVIPTHSRPRANLSNARGENTHGLSVVDALSSTFANNSQAPPSQKPHAKPASLRGTSTNFTPGTHVAPVSQQPREAPEETKRSRRTSLRFLESRINSSSTENIDFEKFVAREGYTYPNLRRSHDYEERLIGMFGEGVGNGEGKKPKNTRRVRPRIAVDESSTSVVDVTATPPPATPSRSFSSPNPSVRTVSSPSSLPDHETIGRWVSTLQAFIKGKREISPKEISKLLAEITKCRDDIAPCDLIETGLNETMSRLSQSDIHFEDDDYDLKGRATLLAERWTTMLFVEEISAATLA